MGSTVSEIAERGKEKLALYGYKAEKSDNVFVNMNFQSKNRSLEPEIWSVMIFRYVKHQIQPIT